MKIEKAPKRPDGCICTIDDETGKVTANFFCGLHGFVAANVANIKADKARRGLS